VSPLEDYYVSVGATTKNEKIAAAAKRGFATGSRKKLIGADNPMYGKAKPDEIKALLSTNMQKDRNPFYGKSHSDETRAKMKAAHAARAPVTCSHCGKQGHLNTMKRWHFDNCRSRHDN
jgi:TPP-dependent indolepyruvate ferredoxin oxidoreductase alpha subunit